MKQILSMLPSAVTLGNLCCGFLSILEVHERHFAAGAWMILLAMIFDIMDGRVARLTKTTGRFGEELDSLADLVSFGVAPAFLFYERFMGKFGFPGLILSCIFVFCGALRLARFNVQASSDVFSGLPIPGGAAIISSLVVYGEKMGYPFPADWQPKVYAVVMSITAMLMISNFEYPAYKKKGAGKHLPKKLVMAAVLLVALFTAPHMMFLSIAVLYAVLGPLIRVKDGFLRLTLVNLCEEKLRNRKAKNDETGT